MMGSDVCTAVYVTNIKIENVKNKHFLWENWKIVQITLQKLPANHINQRIKNN